MLSNIDTKNKQKESLASGTNGCVENDNEKQSWVIADTSTSLSLVSMSIFFICGTFYFQRQTSRYYTKHPFSFLLAGSVCYLGYACVEFYKRTREKQNRIVPSIAILAGALWLIGSIFLFRNLLFLSSVSNSFVIWSFFWMVGSALNIISITYDLVSLIQKEHVAGLTMVMIRMTLGLSWLANLLFFSGCIMFVNMYQQEGGQTSQYDKFSNLLLSASAVYLFHSLFHSFRLLLSWLQ